MIIVNGFQPLTIVTKHSILDVAAVLDPPLATQRLVRNISAHEDNVLSVKYIRNNHVCLFASFV